MIFKNCIKCDCKISQRLFDLNNWKCNNCLVEKLEIKKEVLVENIPQETSDNFKWFKLYTASYLVHKLNKNYNSIKNQTCCVKYKDKYILHSDIINNFIKHLT